MIDVLIIGSGGAGLTAALSAKAKGAKVLVAGKFHPTNSQTSMAQGGINAALGNVGEDSIENHIADTMKSSRNLCDETMVRTMCENAPEAISWLEAIGVPFSRTEEAKIAQRQLGGTRNKRACYSQDYTGLKILHTLYDTCLKEGIEFLDEHYFLNLITQEQENPKLDPLIKGATLLEIVSGEVKQIDAKSVIIATGGYSSIYHGFTTNAFGSTGDGISAVIRAGGYISDIEFVQFHPTALKGSAILISESARGEGGYLLNSKGERFVDELQPRDIVARAIYEQIGNGEEVFLDIRHLGEEKLMELLPQEVHLCKLHEHVDPATELIPIKPVAHYSMGGIDVKRSLEARGIKGCFATGECSNAKVHGANRLGGNSLLELITFGKLAGENATAYATEAGNTPADDTQLNSDRNFINGIFHFTNQINFYEKRDFIGKIFYHNAGIVRSKSSLTAVLAAIRQIQKELPFMGLGDKSRENNTNLVDFIEFGNALELSEVLLVGAISRNESRGAHYREDFPEQSDERYGAHTIFWKEDGVLCADFERRYV
ncbi:MAG: FAD-dependent oxidoreductase [Campylobacterota bacterium]|nr:FAD-dependent oxidoreductase [Campylobacterota bacterium]